MEDSWFWDSEQTTASSASSHRDNEVTSSKSGSGGDLTIIPLDGQDDSTPKLRRIIEEKDQKLKKVKIENAILNEKVNELLQENKNANANIDALDQEHDAALEELLTIKQSIQEKCTRVEKQLKDVLKEKNVLDETLQKHNELQVNYANVESAYVNATHESNELKTKIEELNLQLKLKTDETNELLAAHDEKEKELLEKFEYIDVEKEKFIDDAAKAIREKQSSDIERLQTENIILTEKILSLEVKRKKELEQFKCDNENVLAEHAKQNANNDFKNADLIAAALEKEHNKHQLEHKEIIEKLTEEHKNNLEIVKKELSELTVRLTALTTENNNLKKEISIKDEDYDVQTLKEELQLLRSDFDCVQEIRNRMEQELSEEVNNSQTLRNQMQTIEFNYKQLKEQHQQLETAARKEYDQFKSEASESESKLVQENIVLQKQLIDLKSSKNVEMVNVNEIDSEINISDFTEMLKKYVKIDATKTNFTEILKYIDTTLSTVDQNKNDLEELNEKLHTLSTDKKRIEHERDTLKADLHHYELEVGELMKNNELLLLEIDNIKTGKLETISEQNEDNIINLEKQLEDCSNLNQSLEDEYIDMRSKLDSLEVEKLKQNQYAEKLHQTIDQLQVKLKDANVQLESIEAEKSNLLFEINELKTIDADQVPIVKELQAKIIIFESERSKWLIDAEQIKSESNDVIFKLQQLIDDQRAQLTDSQTLLEKKQIDVKELLSELHQLKETIEKSDERFTEENNKLKEDIQLLQDIVKEREQTVHAQSEELTILQKINTENKAVIIKFIEQQQQQQQSVTDDKSNDEQLEKALEKASEEKQNLIEMIKKKHQENIQYHDEIQRLGTLLTEAKTTECLQCAQIVQQLNTLAEAHKDREEKLNDQVTFLREKSDMLTKSLLMEQTNQKLWHQERIELLASKATLTRDLDRLREHLLEIEDAHTQETVELQQIINETKNKMSHLEEDSKKSSTAYTSAKYELKNYRLHNYINF